jgi:two-component system response regulator LytT
VTYRIAICDDEEHFRHWMRDQVETILQEKGVEFALDIFPSGETLLSYLKENQPGFDLIFLDILMGGLTGIEVAKKIREQTKGISLVFTTSTDQFVFDGYDVQALQYLLKPVDPIKLEQVIQRDLKKRLESKHFQFQIKTTSYHIPFDDILYFESELKATKLITASTTYRLPNPISEVEARLPKFIFCRNHRGFIANLKHVTEINRKYLTLNQSINLPIGKIFAKNTNRAFLDYIGQQVSDN